MRRIHTYILGTAGALSIIALAVIASMGDSRLAGFGPTAQIYFQGIKQGLIVASIILAICFIGFCFFEKRLDKARKWLEAFWDKQTNLRKNLIILGTCIIFSFLSHAGNITNGYFNVDDFLVTSTNHTTPLSQAVMMPYANDHVIPLHRTEIKILDSMFGQNALPYNLFFFLLFSLIPFFTYLAWKRLGYNIFGFIVFLIVFNGATGWADMLTGFYMMTLYLQIIFYFSVAVWSFIAWLQSDTRKQKIIYLVILGLALAGAVATDTAGIWTIPAIVAFMLAIHYGKPNGFLPKRTIADFFIKNSNALYVVAGISIAFATYFYVAFHVVQPNTFLSTLGAEASADAPSADVQKAENWRPLPLAKNFGSFVSSGVSIPLLAPNSAKILAHPAVKSRVEPIWPWIEVAVFVLNLALFYFVMRKASGKDRKFMSYLFAGMIITITMVILARPNHAPIPDLDYRYAGAPFYFYALFLSLTATHFMRAKGVRGMKIAFAIALVIFASQQTFSFHAMRLKEEAHLRGTAIASLDKDFLSELQKIAVSPIMIPNLTGGHIHQAMPGLTLANYILFFDRKMPVELIQNKYMPPDGTKTATMVKSLRASTSPEFLSFLQSSQTARDYYGSPAWMYYEIKSASDKPELTFNADKKGIVAIRSAEFDPEEYHRAGLWLITDDVSGTLELALSAKNDFGVDSPIASIRIDDYTKYEVVNGRRVYHIATDLLQIPLFALSNKVSDLRVSIPQAKNAVLRGISLR